jgi:hypothetical protein
MAKKKTASQQTNDEVLKRLFPAKVRKKLKALANPSKPSTRKSLKKG